MKKLLMIESWCFASGMLLPRKIREMGHGFVLVTRDPEFYHRYVPSGERHPVVALADDVVVCDTNNLSALTDACREVCGGFRPDGVITSCDYYIGAAAEVAANIGLPSAPPRAVSRAVNKYLMRCAHREAELPTPRFFLALAADDAAAAAATTGLPAVVKPADMNGSTLVRKVESVEELREAIAAVLALPENSRGQKRFEGALVEEFLQGEEFSAECAVRNGRVHVLGMTDKQLGGRCTVVEAGHMFPARIPEETERCAADFVEAALLGIGYDNGVAHVEFRVTPKGPRIIEINPRIGGNYISELVERVTGVSPLTQMVQLAIGEAPDLAAEGTERPRSAAVAFVLPERAGILSGWDGEEDMASSPGVVRSFLAPAGTAATNPDDNDCYLGYVIAQDMHARNAGDLASRAVRALRPRIVPHA